MWKEYCSNLGPAAAAAAVRMNDQQDESKNCRVEHLADGLSVIGGVGGSTASCHG